MIKKYIEAVMLQEREYEQIVTGNHSEHFSNDQTIYKIEEE